MIITIFLVILAFIVLLLISNIKVSIDILNSYIKINIIIFRVIKIKVFDKTKTKADEKKTKKAEKNKLTAGVITGLIKDMLPKIKYLLRKTDIKVDMDFKFGLKYPDKTAEFYGLINCLLYSFENVFRASLHSYKSKYIILPDMNHETINFKLKSDFSFKFVYLIIFVVKSAKVIFKYKSYFRSKGGALNVGTSNRRAHENYVG